MIALCVCVCVRVCVFVCVFSVQGPPGQATGVKGDKVGFRSWVAIIHVSRIHTLIHRIMYQYMRHGCMSHACLTPQNMFWGVIMNRMSMRMIIYLFIYLFINFGGVHDE